MKAIALLSGGLDSTLAAKLMLDQGIDLEAINFITLFCTCTSKESSCLASQKAVERLRIPLKIFNVSQEFLEVVRHPKHGYGSNLNPCIDCRIFMLRKAKAYMEASGASFIVTGEVLGQRPMSQRREAMRLIEKEAGLEGLILRPLSAKFLPITIPEREGWVDREKLLNIQGRSRKTQIQLAEQLGVRDYPCPAGGCLLTDPGFSKRLKDLMTHHPEFTLHDVHLLKFGRHFRLSPDVKLIVGRNEEENQKIRTFAQGGDILLKLSSLPGPLSLLRGKAKSGEIEKAAAITVRYSKGKGRGQVEVLWKIMGEEESHPLFVSSLSEGEIEKYMIGG
jgi:tRNA U34 2-thiouridine synthase MnmA/TrmU